MPRNEMARKVELTWLMDFYGSLLTDKQRQVLSLYCEEDLSLTEIAEEAGISRQGVHDMLTRASEHLLEMEAKLGAAARFRQVQDGLLKCREQMDAKQYDAASDILDQLIRAEQEEKYGL